MRGLSTSFVSPSNSYCLSFFGVRTLITPCVSSNSYCLSLFGVRPLNTPFVFSNYFCLSFFGVRRWLLMLYLQTLIVCPSSVSVADYSFCIFKLLLSVILRCTAPDYPFVFSKSCLSFFYVRPLSTSFVSSNHYCLSFFGVRPLITHFVFQTHIFCP